MIFWHLLQQLISIWC